MAIVRRVSGDKLKFQVRVRDATGDWFPSKMLESLKDAKLEESRLEELKSRGVRSFTEDARTVTMNEYWSIWSLENRSKVSKGWKISQDQMWRDYCAPFIGPKTVREVDAPEIGRILTSMRGQGRSDETIRHVYNLLRKMFGDAVEYYEMLVKSPVNPRFHRPKVSGTKRPFLKPDEAWALLESVRDHYIGPAVWLCTLSALRISEVQALRWGSVDFDLEQILIKEIYNKKIGELQNYPKQEDWALAPIPPELKKYLLPRKEAAGDWVAKGFKGGMLLYEVFNEALKRECVKARVPMMTPHELRHSCTELYVQAGASNEDLRRLLNHASSEATQHYIHRTDERLKAIAGGLRLGTIQLIQGGLSGGNRTEIQNAVHGNVPKRVPLGEQRRVRDIS